MAEILTSLVNVKAWADISTDNDDVLLNRLIAQQSRSILSYIERPVLSLKTFTDIYNGHGTDTQYLKNFPVLSVSAVQVGYMSIFPFQVPPVPSPSGPYGLGFVVDPWDGTPPGYQQAVRLRGYSFTPGKGNVQITYQAGFVAQNEAQTVPAGSYQVIPNQTYGNFNVDNGVTYASTGVALTAVANSPATGQYVPPVISPVLSTTPFYQFAAGDSAANVLINYSYVPADLEEACIEMVAERYSYRGRIGVVSKSLGGQETMSYSQKAMPDSIKMMLQPYKKVILV